MNLIMKPFYNPVSHHRQDVPAILGLTASPVVTSKQGSLETLEANLNAIAVTPRQYRTEVDRHVRPPQVISVQYVEWQSTKTAGICSALTLEVQNYDINPDPYVFKLREGDNPRSIRELDSVMTKRRTCCIEQLRALDLRASTFDEELGPWTASWYVRCCISRFKQSLFSGDGASPDLSENERAHLAAILGRIDGRNVQTDREPSSITNKVQKPVDVLRNNASSSPRAIIFVEQRMHVSALAELFARIAAVREAYQIALFVGPSVLSKRKASVADLTDLSTQQQDLEAFRSGAKNLMICTNVLEEGIDIPACNLVICFG